MYVIKLLMKYFFYQDFKMYVQIILDVYKKYYVLVMIVFSNDVGFVVVLDKVRIS